ncbi:PilW family protein [Marinobacterium mangrovicola]|uniref:Prepilin-type N-terminal cleavage/methylation domain-containing protein n=1 Tax=Marinobacterium mangrovicola TaxID=1476959 RepID=A0A4R1GG88_9GAMM|nr:prepilin-type N-terminal cleavage/methylation domain-containing protein [Marinobacterium mangrovicola]TCK05943.1 prepilin-type N-terminal cleavage/methylation domain-containing protein [Marinobacterium mangrovicola]
MEFGKQCRQSGYTLIELMVGLLVGLIVLSGVIYIFLTALRSSTDVLNSTRLNQEVATLSDLMTGELRRAGYWNAQASGAAGTSPYSGDPAGEMALNIVSSTCVLYSYDKQSAGLSTVADTDRSGFRLYPTSGDNGELQYKASAASISDSSQCTNDAGWVSLTDSSFMYVTSLAITDTSESRCYSLTSSAASEAFMSPGCTSFGADPYVTVRVVSVAFSAEVSRDDSWQNRVSETVKIRNNTLTD